MDMLEDYLRAVSRLLPRAKREDIIAELRDEILTRIEAREGELGRKLGEAETEQLLRDFGHPIVVAARYRDGPQYGVGPAAYPYWFFAVRMIFMIEICVSAFVFLARVVSGGDVAQAFGQALGSGLTGIMTLIGFATVAAWLIERKGINIDRFNTWRVRDLRFLDFAFLEWGDVSEWMDKMNTRTGGAAAMDPGYDYVSDRRWSMRQSSAGRGVGAIVVGAVFILWWTGLISFGFRPLTEGYPGVNVDPGGLAAIDMAGLKASLYWPVLIYFAALIAFGAVVLAWPRGVRLRGLLDLCMGLAAMGLTWWVWTASPVADVIRVDSVQAFVDRVAAFFAHPAPFPLVTLVMVIVVFTAIGGLFRAMGGLWELAAGLPRYSGD